jgi:iron complex transport system substrate-binding protein
MSVQSRFTRWFLILAIIILLGACAQPTPTLTPTAAPIVITDGLGKEIHLDTPAQRVISLAPSNTEILFAIGAGPQLVGRDSFSDYPAEAQKATDIGGGFGELNSELVLSLQPDLILAADLTPPEQIKTLEDLGLKVFTLGNPKKFDDLYQNIQKVAQLTGHETQATDLIEDLSARVSAVEQKLASAQERPLVFYELDSTEPNAPWTPGPGTFIDYLIESAGGENIGSRLESEWAQISLESLIADDPAIIILGDFTWGGITPEMVADRAGWDALTAVKSQAVYTFDDNLVSRPGPRLVDGLEAMAKLLHPELFE